MKKASLTITSLAVMVVVLIVEKAGVNIAPESVQVTIATILKIASAVGVWYGRFRQGDINPFGVKMNLNE